MSRPSCGPEPATLAAALARLVPLERDVYVLAAVEGLGNEEIASRLGLPAAEVERSLADAICSLDRALADLDRPWWRFW